MELRPDMNLYRDSDFDRFKTTFSNAPCLPNWCLRQSYPDPYPAENRPKMGYHITGFTSKNVVIVIMVGQQHFIN